jgi:transketolase
MVPEAMRAAWILKEDFGIETRIINMHTLKPFNPPALVQAALETGIIVTAEEHQIGGLANWVSHTLHSAPELYGQPLAFGSIGVKDRFGESGQPWELMWEFEVSGEHIAAKAKELYDFAQANKAKPKAKPAAKKPAAPKKPTAKKAKPADSEPAAE